MADEKAKETPHVCGSCKHWNLYMSAPNGGAAMGACMNDSETSLYGVICTPFAACEGWEEREEKLISVPKKVQRRIIGA